MNCNSLDSGALIHRWWWWWWCDRERTQFFAQAKKIYEPGDAQQLPPFSCMSLTLVAIHLHTKYYEHAARYHCRFDLYHISDNMFVASHVQQKWDRTHLLRKFWLKKITLAISGNPEVITLYYKIFLSSLQYWGNLAYIPCPKIEIYVAQSETLK